MKKKLLQIISTISLALVLFILPCMVTILDSNATKEVTQQTRTISATEDLVDCENVFNAYEDLSFEIEDSFTTFEGVQSINLADLVDIDEVSVEDLEGLSENISIRYKYSYDYETNYVTLEVVSLSNGEEIIIDTINGEAFINEEGNIDAYLEIEEEIILLSELQDVGMVQNCGWFSKMIKKAICRTVVAVAAVTIIAATCGAGLGATILIGAAVGAVVGGGTGAHESYKATGKVQASAVLAGVGVGAAVGAATGAAVGLAKKGIAKVATKIKTPKADIGNKLNYAFGKAGGNAHNVTRSMQNASQLSKIGIYDNAAGRKILTDHFNKALTENSAKILANNAGRVEISTLLSGPGGFMNVKSVWEGTKLITFMFIG